MVVLSSGALGTPLLLERSGVGAAERIAALGSLDLISDLPGVGEGYQDHQGIPCGISALKGLNPEDSADAFLRADPEVSTKAFEEYKSGKGLLARNFFDATIKYRPSPEEVKTIGPDFEKAWTEKFANKPDKPLLNNSFFSGHVQSHHANIGFLPICQCRACPLVITCHHTPGFWILFQGDIFTQLPTMSMPHLILTLGSYHTPQISLCWSGRIKSSARYLDRWSVLRARYLGPILHSARIQELHATPLTAGRMSRMRCTRLKITK